MKDLIYLLATVRTLKHGGDMSKDGFSRFPQSQNSDSTSSDGAMTFLELVKQIIENIGNQIKKKSPSESVGSH